MSDKTIRIVAAIFGLALPLAAILSAAAAAAAEEHAADASGQLDGNRVTIQVDCGQAINTMRGGLGASWHAIEATIPYGVKHPYFDGYSHGGSGSGAYPAADDEHAWQQIYRHARWLGLDWNRVEIEQRIYEPERGKFTFDSPEMRILYRILDWNERNHADVFFQQMWCNTAWLAYPEFRNDPVGRVHQRPSRHRCLCRRAGRPHGAPRETAGLHVHQVSVHQQ